jgi:hypothetical protein
MNIPTVYEGARGCGLRKPGALYLMADTPNLGCPLMPVELDVCPCCGHGIKPARGWTWVDADAICNPHWHGSDDHTAVCPLGYPLGKAGLIWIGEQFYKTPAEFLNEARRMGISRRITAVPRDFKVGETWVLLAHRKAIVSTDGLDEADAAIFTMFRPDRIEYVVRGDETDDELEALTKRGIQPVIVKQPQLALEVQ